jgi:hypothetical protein
MYKFILIFGEISIHTVHCTHCKKCNRIPGFLQNLSFLIQEKSIAESGLRTVTVHFPFTSWEKYS